ncbi:MAG TPA: 30S ribosomal protein S4 [Candidatus Monoglobus merdigallinarum]|uniref:Small ribosomal subunit protein uS4 n=1 Tax=Candidatus Monoglobus merdigallinarum TaxID=2838698 RepID=A0A9D1TMD7_9FIRM|nr:30S ribosomal protein S4 [Candidatus Monoglobus merdigallinarum]
MAKNMQPVLKRCRTLGIEPSVMGYDKSSNRTFDQRRKKQSEYGMQLNEKQKVRFIYGVLEKQFAKYYTMATKMQGVTGECLLSILESRLDNVIYRMGLANTRREARQIVNHGHVTVNGKRVNIPSYLVKPGEVISLKESSRNADRMKDIVERNSNRLIPKWIDMNRDTLEGKIIALADREDIDFPVEEHLIVEFYSK